MSFEQEQKSLTKDEIYGDEYPIIWYEPNFDSEEKKCLKSVVQGNHLINLFSEPGEVLKFAQSLGISFLIIVPNDLEEEKLFGDLRSLKETFGRRLLSFEEETMLKDLAKGISEQAIKLFKVFVFYTRDEYFNEVLIKKEEDDNEDEVIVNKNAETMAKELREDFTIIVCDPNLSAENKTILENELDIHSNIYTDFAELLKTLQTYNDLPYHLVLSGETQADLIADKIADYKDLLILYVYAGQLDPKRNRRIKVKNSLGDLVKEIREGIRTQSKYKNTFPAFATNFDDWDKSHINKVHYYLRGLKDFTNRKQAQGDFIKLAKTIYQSKKLLTFEQEYYDYAKNQILDWYAQESPIYKLLNNCLRIASPDSILYSRFVIKDLERAIKEEYQQENKRYDGVVFRGAYLSSAEYEKLSKNVGKEIEMYGFLSTTVNQKAALNFLSSDYAKKALITIIIPPHPQPELDEQGFANLAKYSQFGNEEEILFNVMSKFQVLEVGKIKIKEIEYRHVVLLYGAQLLRKYMTNESPVIKLEFELPLKPRCHLCEAENNLFAFTISGKTQEICRECLAKDFSIPKDTFLLPIEERENVDGVTKLEIEIKAIMLQFAEPVGLKDYYGYKCNDCLMSGGNVYYKWIDLQKESTTTQCLECFNNKTGNKSGQLLISESPYRLWGKKQEEWEEVFMKYKTEEFGNYNHLFQEDVLVKTQDYDKCQEVCQKGLQSLLRKRKKEQRKLLLYKSFGKSSQYFGNRQQALQSFQTALDIMKSVHGEEHPETATLYSYLASLYGKLRDYQQASQLYQKALKIFKSVYGEEHLQTAILYNNLATVYHKRKDNIQALHFFEKALDIRISLLGEAHPHTAVSYNEFAIACNEIGNHEQALQLSQKAYNVMKAIYGEMHLNTAASCRSLGLVYDKLRDYPQALQLFQKSLDIMKSVYGEMHPETATLYFELGSVNDKLENHEQAQQLYQTFLNIMKSVSLETYLNSVVVYNNLATAFSKLKDYPQAIQFFQKSLDAMESESCEVNVEEIAILHDNLGSTYEELKDYPEALQHFQKSLKMMKSKFGEEERPENANLYNKIGSVYVRLGNYQQALRHFQTALNIRIAIFGHTHFSTAGLYSNLAYMYRELGNDKQALEFFQKSLDITKSAYGEIHPEMAISYSSLGLMYDKLGEYQQALNYQQKSLEITESLYGEKHKTAISSSLLAKIYVNLRNYKQALLYEHKSLKIMKSVYGDTHLETAVFYDNIGVIYEKLGDDQQALQFYQKFLDIKISSQGDALPETANAYNKIALIYCKQGKYQQALQHFQKLLDTVKSMNGETHPNVARSHRNLGSVYNDIGDYQKALQHGQKSLDIIKSAYGETHPEVAASYNDLGEASYKAGNYQQALQHFEKSLDIRKALFEEPPVKIYNNLAIVNFQMGNLQQAIQHFEKSLHINKSLYGEIHQEISTSYNNLGAMYRKLEDHQKALQYFQQSLDIMKSLKLEAHPKTAVSYNDIGSLYLKIGDHQKAIQHFQKSVDIMKSLNLEIHPQTAIFYNNIGSVYSKLEDYQQAIQNFQKCRDIKKLVYGETHSETLASDKVLESILNELEDHKQEH